MPSLKEKRDQWLECLLGKDEHSIYNQVDVMIWDAAAFHVINEARGLAPPAPGGGVQINPLLHELLDYTFFQSQVMAIRRLVDSYPLEGRRPVISLTSLLEDIKKHSRMLTREAIFSAENRPYDYSTEQRWEEKFYINKRHAQIDRLTGKTEETRLPSDRIPCSLFDQLVDRIEGASETIRTHVNNYVAHAAPPNDRPRYDADASRVTFGHLRDAQRAICRTISFVANFVLARPCDEFLGKPNYNQFQYMERPLIQPGDRERLRTAWDQYGKEVSSWTQGGLGEFEKELQQPQ